MKKGVVALIFLLTALTFVNVRNVAVADETEDLSVTYGLPEDVPTEPMPANFTTDDYLDTTNPHADFVTPQGALDEVDDVEGDHPLYVLVFGDEEERRNWYDLCSLDWKGWAKLQLERGDEALVARFGIDIRILGFERWNTDDSETAMRPLWYELEADTKQYLRTWYDGEYWSNYVDAIIGITSQATPEDPGAVGVAPLNHRFLDEGRIFVLLKWRVYWRDDNIVQHEISHLYYVDDHWGQCCVMAYHEHYHSFIYEDGHFWWVWCYVRCAFTSYDWCYDCHDVIQDNSDRYPLRVLTISATSGGTTDLSRNHVYSEGTSVEVTAFPDSGYFFRYWTLDGAVKTANPITVTMDSNHSLKAYFGVKGGGSGGWYLK